MERSSSCDRCCSGECTRWSGYRPRQLASVLAGGLSPFIAAALLNWAGGEPWPVALYMAVIALISVVAVLLARETYRGDIMEEQPEERRLIAEGPGEPTTE